MAKQISEEAVSFIRKSPQLYVDVCGMLNIEAASLVTYLIRKTGKQKLARYDVVVKIAAAMEVSPESILEDVPEKETEEAA